MGKKRFNEKGRRKNETIIDNSEVKKVSHSKFHKSILFVLISLQFQIKVELGNEDEYKTNDTANLLVLPSDKRKTKIKKTTTVTRILSKKQRKHLEKIVDKKKKKEQVSYSVSLKFEICLNIYSQVLIFSELVCLNHFPQFKFQGTSSVSSHR